MLLLVVGVIAAAFYRTIFLGQPISKVCMVAEWDSVFTKYAIGKMFPMDSTMVLMLIPAYFLKAEVWKAGQLPLWNQFNGLGCPMLGDPQSLVLTPLHLLLILSPTLRAYNLTLVCEATILGISMYLLCRTLRISPKSSVFGALTLTFCPFLLWYLEILGNGYCLIPGLFCMFARAARVPSALRCAWAGVACAILVLSSHPEISFFAISFASLFFLICRFTLCLDDRRGTNQFQSIKQAPKLHRTYKPFVELSIAAGVALCLAAPMLLPFAEFLANSESYKFDLRNPARMPLETLSFNLFQPTFGGASPFLGIVALTVLPLSLCVTRQRRVLSYTFSGLAVLAASIGAKIWPVNLLLEHKPFAYLIANYCFPVLLVLVAVIATFGFEQACRFARLGWLKPGLRVPLVSLMAMSILGCTFFWLMKGLNVSLIPAHFDMCLPPASLGKRDWINNSVCLASLIPVLLAKPLWNHRFRTLTVFGCIAIGFVSQALISKSSMPVQSKFEYPVTDVIQELKGPKWNSQRYIATGNHLFRPNTGSIYELRDLRQVNPIFPARYLKFMDKAGAKIDDFNQVFGNTLSPLLDAAGVAGCLSQTPVIGTNVWQEAQTRTTSATTVSANGSSALIAARIADGLTLKSVRHLNMPNGIYGDYTIETTPAAANRYTIGFVLSGMNDETIWFGDQNLISNGGTFCYSVPTLGRKPPFKLGVHVFDLKASKFIVPPELGKGSQTVLTVAEYHQENSIAEKQSTSDTDKPSWVTHPPKHLSGNIFLYSNPNSLSECYIAHKARVVSTASESLHEIADASFIQNREVILEGNIETKDTEARGDETDLVSIKRPSATNVSIETNTQSAGWLVLTDIFYPGWKASIDSKPTEILRANYAFRAVALPAGKHIVQFVYEPVSVLIGFGLAFGCAVGLATAHLARGRFFLRRPDSSS